MVFETVARDSAKSFILKLYDPYLELHCFLFMKESLFQKSYFRRLVQPNLTLIRLLYLYNN